MMIRQHNPASASPQSGRIVSQTSHHRTAGDRAQGSFFAMIESPHFVPQESGAVQNPSVNTGRNEQDAVAGDGSSPATCPSEPSGHNHNSHDGLGSNALESPEKTRLQGSADFRSDSAEFRSGGEASHPTSAPNPPVRNCLHCGREFRPERIHRTTKNAGLYCCRKCAGHAPRRPAPFATPPATKAERIRANGLVNMRVRRGAMERPDRCQQCGKVGRVDGHHDSYTAPGEVMWLCRSHHMLRHRDLALGKLALALPAPTPTPGDPQC
jgi:hypothetical protein